MFKLALCQIKGSFDKKESMATVTRYVETAAENGAQVISLPEMWNCPYSNDYFREYAEAEDGPTVKFLSDLAAKHDIYLIGGSIPELDGGKVYNTSFSFDRSGQIIGKHRKVHLFDIDVKGGIRFMESDTLTAGKDMTILDTEFGKIGVAICYDVRFPEWFRKMALVNRDQNQVFRIACRCKADRASGCFQYDDRTGTLGYNDACACAGQSGIFCGEFPCAG